MPVGSVVDFDDPAGYGSVVDEDGGGPWFFHCTAIRDGSRTIAVGTRVAFEVVPGHRGRYEATDVHPA